MDWTANGNVTMSGGIVIVNGPTQGGNGALDYNGTFEITGGTLVAAGTTDMAMNVVAEHNDQWRLLSINLRRQTR